MRSRRGIALALAASLVFGVPIAAGSRGRSAQAQTGIVVRKGVTQPVFSYKDAIRETVYIQSTIDGDQDGQLDQIATDIIRPKESNSGLKVPVIYEMSPYYQTLGRGNESEEKQPEDGDFRPEFFPLFYDNYFVPRGYAFIAQDMRGTRNSQGCMILGGEEEAADAVATINWLNGKGKAFTGDGQEVKATWSTGKVGMIGKSYDGTIANAAASTGVPGLKTIVPIAAISRWYDYMYNNGVQYTGNTATAPLFVYVIDQPPGDDTARADQWVRSTFTENSTCMAQGSAVAGQAADPRGDYTEFWDNRDYIVDRAESPGLENLPTNVGKVKASVFVVHGLNDFNVKPPHYQQWWRKLARHRVPRKIWLTQTGHVDPFDFRRKAWVRTLHRWFDRWLHGIQNGIMGERQASVQTVNGRWQNFRRWPIPGSRPTPVFLSPRKKKRPGTLSLRPPRKLRRQVFTDDPRQSERTMMTNRYQEKRSRLIFVSRKLRRRTRISGYIRMRLFAQVNRTDTNFTAILVDYGKTKKFAWDQSGEGIRNTQEESCHGQSTEQDDACYRKTENNIHETNIELVSIGWLDAKHWKTLSESNFLEAGKTYPFRWEMFADDYVFKRGHRIGVVVAGSDATETVPDQNEAQVTVLLKKSRIVLPVVGGRAKLRRARI